MDGSPLPGILQARVLEWVAIAFSDDVVGITLNLLCLFICKKCAICQFWCLLYQRHRCPSQLLWETWILSQMWTPRGWGLWYTPACGVSWLQVWGWRSGHCRVAERLAFLLPHSPKTLLFNTDTPCQVGAWDSCLSCGLGEETGESQMLKWMNLRKASFCLWWLLSNLSATYWFWNYCLFLLRPSYYRLRSFTE